MRPKTTLLRAAEFAKILNGPLIILGILPAAQVHILFPHRNLTDSLDTLKIESTESRRIWRWSNKILLNPLPPDNVIVAQGENGTVAAEAVKNTRAQLVIVPDTNIFSGSEVTDLADRLLVPILISRFRQVGKAIVASTDFLNDELPVLKMGGQLGEELQVPVTFIHNAQPPAIPTMMTSQGMFALTAPLDDEFVKDRQDRLQKAADGLGKKAHSKVLRDFDTVEAILGFAKSKKADLIVVGHSHRSWLNRLFGVSVSASIASKAKRSVLVIPLDHNADNDDEQHLPNDKQVE